MLIKFEFENYRSVRDTAELSLVAVNYYKEKKEQLIDAHLPGLSGIRYLRSAAIFGPNASGKSTVLQALFTMRSMVLNSASYPANADLPYNPFKLSQATLTLPTRFFVAFVVCGVRYEYAFSYTDTVITEESLRAFPKGREQVWFVRTTTVPKDDGRTLSANETHTVISDSSSLRIPTALHPLLNDNVLLLSLLANYPKFDESTKVKPIFEWFAQDLMMVDRGPRSLVDYPYSGEILFGETGTDFQRHFIQSIMRKADVGISEARVEVVSAPDFIKDLPLMDLVDMQEPPDNFKTVVFDHESERGKVALGLGDESDGTYNLFCLSGYVAQALENGATLFVDELDASLHPVIVREVIRCFLDPQSNTKNAQLVFTAHNPCLLDESLLRRDQIWLTEKADGATSLYPLSDYRPRKDESLVNGYLMGRYSATPVVPACFGMCNSIAKGENDGE